MPEYHTSDILQGIFAFFPDGENQFTYDCERFQGFFYERQREYPLLQGLAFMQPRRDYYVSTKLSAAYETLMFNGVVKAPDFTGSPHEFSPVHCRKIISNTNGDAPVGKCIFSDDDLRQVKALSQEFQHEFSLEQRV